MTTTIAVPTIPSRHFAGLFDLSVEGPSETGPGAYDSDAIGGSFSMEWNEYYKDAETGEVYKVRCSDGVYGGKSAHSDKDEQLRSDCYYALLERFHAAEQSGKTEIIISRNERAVMDGHTHACLLESKEDANDGEQSKIGFDGGLVGHYHGIPVMCDLQLQDLILPASK
jgi:hypothetical protein